jgi:predicted metal-dependent phosphoesterase TrpH
MHCHTTRSDGYDSPQELIDRAASLGMTAIAITDHDIHPPLTITVEGVGQVNAVEYARQKGILLVPGYEFSTDTWVDEVHICGYGLDWSQPMLQAEVRAAAQSKVDGYHELCVRLTRRGMPIDWEQDILHFTTSTGELAQRSPEDVQRKHIFEAMAARGYAESWSAAKLVVRNDPDLNVRRRKIDPLEAIGLIHACGGVAVLAHPYLIDEVVHTPGKADQTRVEYIEHLVEAGLDGIEIRYTYDKTTYQGTLSPEEIEIETRARYAGRLNILSGGSDYHAGQKGKEKKIRCLGERGLTVEEFKKGFAAIL